jgi:hypothetical protein
VRVDGWDRCFFDVLTEMLLPMHAGRTFIINPVAGPESIAGSSRT